MYNINHIRILYLLKEIKKHSPQESTQMDKVSNQSTFLLQTKDLVEFSN